MLNIEITYVDSETVICMPLQVPIGTNIQDALKSSGILEQYPKIDIFGEKGEPNFVGVFGEKKTLDYVLSNQDQIEIYRPLKIDPMVARKEKVKKEIKEKRRKFKGAVRVKGIFEENSNN